MSGKRYYNEDQAATCAFRPQKKVQHGTLNTLSHDSYTIAWICALSLEMSAARAMLDYVHDALPQDVNDSNCYALGTIGKHNVTIACLPDGHYGTNNAAIVFTNMRRTFNNIQLGLMVGIGGGAPTKADLRLGDIVVGSKVIQHDMGKAMTDGVFNRTSIPRHVSSSISTVVSSLRSKHCSSPSRVSSILWEKSQGLQGFERPLSADRLFEDTYRHVSSTTDCASCDQSKLVQRTPRDSDNPVIHYGAIASGNQVIKNSLTRDNLAEELDVICFEMEAAGLMDICPCLPVRGICDYSDSHKAKEWQRYAAATAAAYAREFLEELAVSERQQQGARQRQVRLEERDNECLKDLRVTNPEDDKEAIIKAKGGLLIESYRWVMENEGYRQWAKGNENRLLWIKGDPGKGKTMLLCGIINELESSTAPDSVFYFFCQASEPRLRSASAVLRGLIWFLARRRPNLIPHIRKEYDDSGKDVFKDHNAWQALSNIMASMLDDETTSDCIFVVDALDECSDDREWLIELLTRFSSTSNAKWILSSRNWLEMEAQLNGVAANRVHLELNHASIADAVRRFIIRRVEDLAKKKRYSETTREAVQEHLLSNANDTFLWVSLVCEELAKFNVLPHHTLKVLQSFPAGLDKLYQRMINQILHSRDQEVCKAILATVTAAFEPLSLAELASSDERLACFQSDLETLSSIVTCCGSFLTLRNNIVYAVHQSVRDYLVTSSDIFPSSVSAQHYSIFQSTLQRIQATLHRNVYNAPDDSLYVHEISKPQSSVLDSLRYGCIYWVDHLHKSASHGIESPSTYSVLKTFLKTKYLYWLEAMSLLSCVSTAIRAVKKLESVMSESASTDLKDLVEDALRFALAHRDLCDTVPLQLYDSALIFSPEQSQVRQNFASEISASISVFASSFQQWDASLFTIPYIADSGSELKVSPDGQNLAMRHDENTILILDSLTGEIIITFTSYQHDASILGFDAPGKHLATASSKGSGGTTVTIWNIHNGECINEFDSHGDILALSQDRLFLALAEARGLIHVCNPWDGSGNYTINLRHGEGWIEWIDFGFTKSGAPCLFSIVCTYPAKGSRFAVVIQDPQTGQVIERAPFADEWRAAALDPCGKRLLIAQNTDLQFWNGKVLVHLPLPEGSSFPSSIAWAPNGLSFAVAIPDAVILCDPTTEARTRRIPLTNMDVRVRLCYVSGTALALLDRHSLRMLRVTSTPSEATSVYEQELKTVEHLNPGPNGQLELSRRYANNEIVITTVDRSLHRLNIPDSYSTSEGVFSTDNYYAFVGDSGQINIWDTHSCLCLHKLRGNANDTKSSRIHVAFDPSGRLVSVNHEDGRIRIWNPRTGRCLHTSSFQHVPATSQLAASTDGCIAMVSPQIALQDTFKTVLYTRNLGFLDGGKAEWTLETTDVSCLSFSSKGLLAVLWFGRETYLSILDVNLGTCVTTCVLPWGDQYSPYATFKTGSNSQIDVSNGVLELDLERLAETEEVVDEERFRVHSKNALSPVWNQQFLSLDPTSAETWLTRGSKRVLWLPQIAGPEIRVTPNFDTGVSMVSMIDNSHPLTFHIRGGQAT
ncbi:uncharacterized protein B0J16DRAFT_406362 [Fusarium flagelliforme]|uniref:uncharacterized protein n=1 Tax=Fusarium flagelliforme TaxID=2675880 RepID=UPI001E8CD304|nr:uncharacterized protein B0J16DRAFT_406362 [Fusarium flagelliforme]KAH7173978.1 hypothetical protein B0J16DRAFT_406362 [Fusarium flagelliforme]